jgi:hypothetical protein
MVFSIIFLEDKQKKSVICIHLFDSGILLIIDLSKKKMEKGGG